MSRKGHVSDKREDINKNSKDLQKNLSSIKEKIVRINFFRTLELIKGLQQSGQHLRISVKREPCGNSDLPYSYPPTLCNVNQQPTVTVKMNSLAATGEARIGWEYL